MGRIRHFVREASITLTLALGVFLGVQAWLTRATPQHWTPPATLTWLLPDGTVQRGNWSDLRTQIDIPSGQAIALHVWATWCGICRAEESTVTALGRKHPVVTLATRSGDAASVRAYLHQRGLPWVTVLDPDGSLAAAHGWRSVPVFAVLNASDQLRHVTVGYTTGVGMRLRLWAATLRESGAGG